MGDMGGASMTSALRLRGRNLLLWHHQLLHLQEDTPEHVEASVAQEEESLESGPERELSLVDTPAKQESSDVSPEEASSEVTHPSPILGAFGSVTEKSGAESGSE